MKRLFKQFSFPGGIPSHAAPGDARLDSRRRRAGLRLVHAYGAVFDNPDLMACCVVGDGEAETGPLATSWHSNKFLNPARDGAVLPILHLNGYKIANPTVLARIDRRRTDAAVQRLRIQAVLRGRRRARADASADGGDAGRRSLAEIKAIQQQARVKADRHERPAWPMIVLRTPKGWTGPEDCGRQTGRRDVARPTRCRVRTWHQTRPPEDARRVDAELPPGGAVRRERASSTPNSLSWRRKAIGAWAPILTPTADCC